MDIIGLGLSALQYVEHYEQLLHSVYTLKLALVITKLAFVCGYSSAAAMSIGCLAYSTVAWLTRARPVLGALLIVAQSHN